MAGKAEVEVIIWDPAGWGASSFGHVSVVVREGADAMSYSLAPGGCDIRAFAKYLAKQDFRNGYGLILRLNEPQTASVANYFRHRLACEYSFLGKNPDGTNNCTTPIQRALQSAGVQLNGFSIMPRALGINLWNRSLVGGVRQYMGGAVAGHLMHPPWVVPSSAYPWAGAGK